MTKIVKEDITEAQTAQDVQEPTTDQNGAGYNLFSGIDPFPLQRAKFPIKEFVPEPYPELTEESKADLKRNGIDIDKLIRISQEVTSLSAFSAIMQHILETSLNEPADYEDPDCFIDGFKELTEEISRLAAQNDSYKEFQSALLTTAMLARRKAISGKNDFVTAEDHNEYVEILNNFVSQINDRLDSFSREYEKSLVKLKALESSGDLPENVLQAITPNRHVMPNNKLMNAMQDSGIINNGAFDLVVSNASGRRKELTAYTMIEYKSEPGTSITAINLTEYERQVSDAIVSLWEQARADNVPPVFTPDMIYRAMPGGGDHVTSQQRGSITKAIDRFRQLHIYVDATDELQKRGKIQQGETFVIDDYYLSATRAEYKTKNGHKKAIAYKINTEPILLKYAKQTGQILSVPAKYIEIKDSTGATIMMSADRQAITGYLLRQIEWIKYDRNHKKSNPRSNTILFETLFADVGIDTTSRTTANRHRDFVFEVLDYWKSVGSISDYGKQIRGRTIIGVLIIP